MQEKCGSTFRTTETQIHSYPLVNQGQCTKKKLWELRNNYDEVVVPFFLFFLCLLYIPSKCADTT